MKLPPTEEFRAAMAKAGLNYEGPILADGKLHRFKAGEDREPNSWYVFHDGTPAVGTFGCWKRQIKERWSAKPHRQCSAEERKAIQRRWERADARRREEEARARRRANGVVRKILGEVVKAEDSHPYLIRKGIRAPQGLLQWRTSLVIPLRSDTGDVATLQFIDVNGEKRFLRGGQVAGSMAIIGDESTLDPIVICEGYATGATIYESTGCVVACAMNCGNLLAVAEALRKRWPTREIIIAADNDQFTEGNPGLTKATKAASAVGARLVSPQFKDSTTKPTDFNDLQQLEGIESVKSQLGSTTSPIETDAECFIRLAGLSPADYDRCRKTEASRLRIRVETLDKEIRARRCDTGADENPNSTEPWDSPVDGAELLSLIATTYERFCVLPNHASGVLAVWVLLSYCYRWFNFAAMIAVWSPEAACGKGRVLDVTNEVAMNPFRTSNTSAAVLYHQVNKGGLTVLIDELDSQSEEQVAAISNILKSGFQSNGKAHRMAEVNGKQEVVEFSTFAPKMIAAITLGALDKATRSRAISIRMTRKPRDTKIEKFRRFDGTEIRRKCLRWIADNEAAVKAVGHLDLSECATDRQEDVWEPLVAIARVAGGDWESRIREAARQLSGAATAAAPDSIAHQLLESIKSYFDNNRVSQVGTKQLIAALNESGDFADCNKGRGLTAAFLARQLGPYGVSTRTLRNGKDTFKGYDAGDFESAFASYLPDTDVSSRHNVTTTGTIERKPVFENVTGEKCDGSENTVSTHTGAGCDVVTFQKAETGSKEAKTLELVEEVI